MEAAQQYMRNAYIYIYIYMCVCVCVCVCVCEYTEINKHNVLRE